MKILSKRASLAPGFVMAATVALGVVGCGSSNSTTSGSGGKTGTGGAGGLAAGTGGAGGAIAGTGGVAPPDFSYTFDTSVQGFVLNNFADNTSVNLAGNYPPVTPPPADGGSDAGAGDGGGADGGGADAGGPAIVKPTLEFDGTTGSPSPGSLKVSVTFTDFNQYVDAVLNLPSPTNFTGKIFHARLQHTSGDFSGGAQFHISSVNFLEYDMSAFTIPALLGTFTNAMIDTATVNDPTTVMQVGIQIFSGSPTGAGPYANAGVPVVFNIDTITD